MKRYKIYYRFYVPGKFFESMKLEQNIDAESCGIACDNLRKIVETNDLKIKVLEVYELVLNNPENIVLPQDL